MHDYLVIVTINESASDALSVRLRPFARRRAEPGR